MTDKNKYSGIFITFEGGEGTGKSTQIKKLADVLSRDLGIDAVVTREPGGTDLAEKVRALLVQRDGGDWDPMSEVLLLFTARREHLVKKIWPALEEGKWVLSDRFADSTQAMQGNGHGVPQDNIDAVYQATVGDFEPDLTFVFDIDPVVGLSRSTKRLQGAGDQGGKTEDRFERMELDFHKRLREGFLEVARKNPQRCVVIDASQDIDVIHDEIVAVVKKRFPAKDKKAGHG